MQAAADLVEEYPDGVWLVELAALTDPALVPQTVAAELRVREEPGRRLVDTLTASLRPRSLLLVLDNCEHLVEACAELAESLLRSCPHLRILATSREALGIAGEIPQRVPSLLPPDPDQLRRAEGDWGSMLAQSEAARLFIERAQTLVPGFVVTHQSAPAVAQGCRRLDGIPLALELAAARVKVLSVEQMADRLDDVFRLLPSGSRTALPRHQTLRALIDWSYHLLEEGERKLLRRLTVFAGGWTLGAAEAVCAGDGIEAWEVLDLLSRLADKSLVMVEDAPEGGLRYRLLETVRQYGREQLAQSGEHPDGADTVAWIRRQSWCNGKIATFGMPLTQLLLAAAGPEGIVGQYPGIAPLSLYHYGFYQNGVFRKNWEGWLRDAWPPEVLPLFRQHPSYDAFWQAMDLRTRLGRVRWPMVHVAGWFDLFSQGTLDAFSELQERGGKGARGRQYLVIGPWTHFEVAGGTFSRQEGKLTFPANAGFPSGAPDAFRWLLFWLKDEPTVARDEPAVRYYVMGDVTDPGAPGNVWRAAERWPPPSRPLCLYFTPDGGLAPHPPAMAAREFDYHPAHPVPTIGGQEAFVPAGPRDQRPVEERPDVLTFTTAPLARPLEVTGRLWVRLFAATSAPDTDFTAKLCDVYPDGRSMLLADGIVRARSRQSLTRAVPVNPGRPYRYDIDLWSTSIIFNKGHRIRVAISSSNAPRFEPNPNLWPAEGQAHAMVAHQTIRLGGSASSAIVLPVIGASSAQRL